MKTMNFANTLDFPFPFQRGYRGYSDSRLELPATGEISASNPLSCEVSPSGAQCAADTAYFQNIVGWLVATSPGSWVTGYTAALTITSVVSVNSAGSYDLTITDSKGQQASFIQNINFDATSARYIANVVNPKTPLGGTTGDININYEPRPSFLNNDPTSTNISNPYVVRQPSLFQGIGFGGMTDGIPTDPAYSASLDAAIIGNQANNSGMFAFQNPDSIDINLLCIPGFSSGAVIAQALQMCELRGDVLFLVDPPFGLRPQQVVDWHNGMLLSDLTTAINSSYGALYWGWQEIFDQYNNINIWVPPSGLVAAMYSNSASVAQQWSAPAGQTRGTLPLSLNVEYNPSMQERNLLYGSGNAVNPIVNFPKNGITVWGDRTLQRDDSALNRVPVRLLLIYIKQNLIPLLMNYVFEPNDQFLWRQVVATIEPFLGNIQANLGLVGYSVVCDSSNNTPQTIDNGQLIVSIFLQPTRTAEFIALNLVTISTGASFSAEQVLAAGGIISASA